MAKGVLYKKFELSTQHPELDLDCLDQRKATRAYF
jgi:hypothetical protein